MAFNNGNMELKQHKNPLVIYHGNCADGFSAAWVFHNAQDALETEFDFHAGVYNDPPPDVTDRVVYLVDFSYRRTVVLEMLDKAKHIYLIDHHKTAIEDLLGALEGEINSIALHKNFTAYTDLERSGAMLAWDFIYWTKCMSEEYYAAGEPYPDRTNEYYIMPPKLLEHIQDRDLWKFKLPLTREIQAAVFSFEYTFENWDKLMAAKQDELLILSAGGAAIERKHHKDIKEMVSVCRRYLSIGSYYVPVASLPYIYSSDAGHLMAKEHENGTMFAACYWDTSDHRIFSLRSCDHGVDVSEVAKQYGGGGHRNAAGFRVPRDHILALY